MYTSNQFKLNKMTGSLMKVNKWTFSMLELMAVIFVIAVLFSLLLPTIAKVKKTSLNILCTKNMKDLHTLMIAYANDHGNVLPGTSPSDHPEYISSEANNWSLYANWNGHLIPYIDPGRKSLVRDGKFRIDVGRWERRTTKPIPLTPNVTNADVMLDSETGSGTFRMFYCPDVMQNAIDPGIYYNAKTRGLDVEFPKMQNAASDGPGYGYSGTPTTYFMNNYLAQEDGDGKPIRISQVNNFGKKGLLFEGGCTGYKWYASLKDPNFHADQLSYTIMGFFMTHTNQFSWQQQKLTFIHDDEKELWYSVVGNNGHPFSFMREKLSQFNDMFCEGRNGDEKAYATMGGSYNGTYGSLGYRDGLSLSFITHKNPYSDMTQANTLHKLYRGQGTWSGGFTYVSNQKLYEAGTGKTNLLFGDGSVETKHASWMFVNKDELFNPNF